MESFSVLSPWPSQHDLTYIWSHILWHSRDFNSPLGVEPKADVVPTGIRAIIVDRASTTKQSVAQMLTWFSELLPNVLHLEDEAAAGAVLTMAGQI